MGAPGLPSSQAPKDPSDFYAKRFTDLERQMRELAPSIARSVSGIVADLTAQQATLTTTVSNLSTAVSDLASRVTVTTSAATFNTGSLPNDAVFHEYGADIPITISVPTGHIVVSVGCGEASLNSGGNAVSAEATFSISGGYAAYGEISSRAYLGTSAAVLTSNSLMVQRAFSVTPGTYTITGKMRAWAGGTSTASVQFQQPYLTVQVTG